MNVDGSNNPGPLFFGEEAVPKSFRELEYPTFIEDVRQKLFGSNPDRSMLNYRLRQLMEVLHSTDDLAGHVRDFDPRITYTDSLRTDIFAEESFQPVITQIAGASADLHVQSGPTAPDLTGRVFHQYTVSTISDATARVRQDTPPVKESIFDYTFNSGISSRIDLFDSGYGVLLSTNTTGTAWKFEVRNRPTFDVGQIVEDIATLGEPLFLQLFGVAPEEPMLTFFQLWDKNKETAFRLGGLLLALATRADEVRRGVLGQG
jgi:hypothetical protein